MDWNGGLAEIVLRQLDTVFQLTHTNARRCALIIKFTCREPHLRVFTLGGEMASGGGSKDNPIVLVSPLKLPKSPDSLVKCRWVSVGTCI